MSKQPRALELAAALEDGQAIEDQAAALLRSQHELIGELVEALEIAKREIVESGNWDAHDFRWPLVKQKVGDALSKAKDQQ